MRTALELFHDIRVATPCTANWDEMTGTDQVRFCDSCQKNVYNLSEMMIDDAIALIQEKEGHLCTRFYRRADGTILTADCRNGAVPRRGRAGLLAASVAGLLGLAGCTAPVENDTQAEPAKNQPQQQQVILDPRAEQPVECVMGGLAPPKEILERLPPGLPANVPMPPARPATDELPPPRLAGN